MMTMNTSNINSYRISTLFFFPRRIVAVQFVHALFVSWFGLQMVCSHGEKLTCIRYSHLDGFVSMAHRFLTVMGCSIGALFNGLCSPGFCEIV